MYEFSPPDKRRPVLVLSRAAAIEVLHGIIVVPITTTVRGIPSEVLLNVAHGLKSPSAATLDNVQTVPKGRLERFVGHVDEPTMRRVCTALAVATGCG